MEKLHTYQGLAVHFHRSVKTMKIWFGPYVKFKMDVKTKNSGVLIPDSIVQKFIQKHLTNGKIKFSQSRRKGKGRKNPRG